MSLKNRSPSPLKAGPSSRATRAATDVAASGESRPEGNGALARSGLSSPREGTDEVVMKATNQRRIDRTGIGWAPGSRVRSGFGTGRNGIEVEDLDGLRLPFQHPTG